MNISQKLVELPRTAKQAVMMATDALILPVIVWAAFALRMGEPWPTELTRHLWLLLAVPAMAIPCFAMMGLYRAVVRYMGPQAVVAVVKGVTLSALAFVALVALLRLGSVPRTTYFLYWMLGLLAVGGTRFIARAWFQSWVRQFRDRERVAIYGAGEAGVQLARALQGAPEYQPLVFVDDDPSIQGTVIHGLRVHGPDDLPGLIDRYRLTEVLLAVPSATRARRREIVGELERLSVHVKTMPSMGDIISGVARLDEIREVDIDDLLGRDSVMPDAGLMDRCIKGKHVMVTGAGGSIGSELCRQIIQRRPRTLVLFEQNEYALYRIERELRAMVRAEKLKVKVVGLLGSVMHQRRLERVMKAFSVDTVYHAAAYKHVPIVEENVLEGVQNNAIGTLRTAEAALKVGVESFVLISTDKAVRPTNVMGATKRFAELILQALAASAKTETCFSMVRFGNVLGSSGSVVPLFRQQIAAGGPVTVTHPEITRYFMTIPEAAALVIQAGAMAEGGDVFVLDMGEPVKILDLARKMIHLSGLDIRDEDNPDGDVEITFTGLRPGEKLYEELLLGENVTGTAHPMIMRANETFYPIEELNGLIDRLVNASTEFDCEEARRVLQDVVDGYGVKGRTNDLLWRQIHDSLTTPPQNLPSAPAKIADHPTRMH